MTDQTDCRGTIFKTPTNEAPTPGTPLQVPNGDGTYSNATWYGEVVKK